MHFSSVSLFFPALVSAHGFVQQIWLGDNLVDTWNPYKDPQKDPPVNKITRKFEDNGPVTDGLFEVSGSTFFHSHLHQTLTKYARLTQSPVTLGQMARTTTSQ